MKRKIVLFASMLCLFVFIFALSISAQERTVPSADTTFTVNGTAYPIWDADEDGTLHPLMWYKDGEQLLPVRADNMDSSKAPYVKYNVWSDSNNVEMQTITITDANGKTFNGKETVVIANLNNVYLRNDGRGVTLIHKNAFRDSTVLKAVYIPNTIKALGWGNNDNHVSFSGCSALEYVEFPSKMEYLTTIGSNTFQNCTSLKAISIPEGIKKINTVAFAGCTSLQAIYLPSTLEEFADHNWNTGAFYNCTSAYFVSEPFTLNTTCTNIPAKPTVYYFPKNLKIIDETTRNMANLNDVIVFGDKMTVFDSNGFTGTGTSGQVKTVVFTADMEYFKLGDATGYTINFVFTNVTDTSVISARTDRGYVNSVAYLCKAGKTGALGYGVKWSDGTTHLENPDKTETIGATCTSNTVATTYCFCGQKIGTQEVESSALGHEFNVENGATLVAILYNNGFSANGCKQIECSRCNSLDETQSVDPIFEGFGYSTREEDGAKYGMVMSYIVNTSALNDYEAVNNVAIGYGVLAIAKSIVSGNPLANDGSTELESITTTAVTGTKAVDLIIWGSADAWNGTLSDGTAIKDLEFYVTGYVTVNGQLSYFCGANSSATLTDLDTISYNRIK